VQEPGIRRPGWSDHNVLPGAEKGPTEADPFS